jgi:polysaccharide export outer membrane protein
MRGGRQLLAAATLAVLAGCASTPGGKVTLFPEGHRLMDSARYLREVSAPPPGAPRELDKCVAGPYVVEPGDVLLVQPASLDSPVRLPGDQPVLPDGTIQLGRYGRMQVAGKTVETIEIEVNALIKSQVADAGPIIVRLVTRDSKVFYVLGEVNAPGSFQLKGRETVLDAIIAAGGLTSGASRRSIILTRPTAPDSCRTVLPVHYGAIVQLGDTTTNYQLKAGDRVYVPSKSMWEDIKACLDKKPEPGPLPVPCYPATPHASLGLPAKMTSLPPPDTIMGPAVIMKPTVILGPASTLGAPERLPTPKETPPPPDPPPSRESAPFLP